MTARFRFWTYKKHNVFRPHVSSVCMRNIWLTLLYKDPWWRHQMETFSALLAICAGNSPVPGEFPTQRPVTRSFDVFFDVRPNKQLSKQSWGWWFETLSPSLWRHRNAPSEWVVNTVTVQNATQLYARSVLLYNLNTDNHTLPHITEKQVNSFNLWKCAAKSDIYSTDKWLHLTAFCGMQLFIHDLYTQFWPTRSDL